MKTARLVCLTASVAMMLGVNHVARAVMVIDVDFNTTAPTPTYTGQAVYTGDGLVTPTWNGIFGNAGSSSFSSGAMVKSDGTSTPVTVAGSGFTGITNVGSGTPASALVQDYAYTNAGVPNTGTITISNLPLGVYDLYVYSVNGFHYSAKSTFAMTIGGSGTLVSDNAIAGSTTSFVEGKNYVHFSSLTPVGGIIAFTDTHDSGGSSALNGFQIVQVPEPASLGLLAVSCGAMLVRRRDRNR